MRINLAVIGAGSLIGRHLCKRAVRIGWDVHAFSVYDVETIQKQSASHRQRFLYDKGTELDWLQHISWVTDCNYDYDFDALREEIRNVAGLVYFHEETPQSDSSTFEENVIHLSKLAGSWSVRHFIAVQSEKESLSEKAQHEIGESNPFMIVSLLRPGRVYSYSRLTSCLPVYKSRTLRSLGIDTPPTDIINADSVAKCITTLIHNTNDPNIYRVLEGHAIEQYLAEQKVPFDSPEYDFQATAEDEDNAEDDLHGNKGDDDDEEE